MVLALAILVGGVAISIHAFIKQQKETAVGTLVLGSKEER